jgi:allantoate deiminase
MTEKTEILEILEELNNCTQPGLGISRFTYTPEYKKAAGLLKTRMKAMGLTVWEDAVGTVYGRWEGENPALAPVMTGSHLDTVPQGGKYDGAAGIACALAAVSALKKEGFSPKRPVEIVAFAEEEGTRWPDSMFSPRYISGSFPMELLEQRDPRGIPLRQALKDYGLTPPAVSPKKRDIGCFLELHIEQGPLLWHSGAQIGVVTTIAGMKNIEVTLQGKTGHAGTTPMDMRQDALCAAAELVLSVQKLAEACGRGTVATVGRLQVLPGGTNVIPGQVRFSVDLRSNRPDILEELTEKILSVCHACPLTKEAVISFCEEPVSLHKGLEQKIEDAAEKLGLSTQRLSSGAGHDSMVMASFYPTGMIFIPCRDGLSHCPEEDTSPEMLSAGADTLAAVIRDIASDSDAVLDL